MQNDPEFASLAPARVHVTQLEAVMSPELLQKHSNLQDLVQSYGTALVAFSGGVDSTFLLRVALDALGSQCHAVTCISPTMARSEQDDARRLGAELGLGKRHHVIESDELSREGFAANPVDRCALCKTELMELATPLASRLGIDAILLGTNTDDLGDYRPGIESAQRQGALAPMVDAGLTKQDVRELSRALGLRTWNKPQLACLSSRFPHGTHITKDRLDRVDRFEDGLRALGFRQLRVRFHNDVARVEIDEGELARAVQPNIRAAMLDLGQSLGFRFVTLDLAGFRSGSLNPVGLVQLGRKLGS